MIKLVIIISKIQRLVKGKVIWKIKLVSKYTLIPAIQKNLIGSKKQRAKPHASTRSYRKSTWERWLFITILIPMFTLSLHTWLNNSTVFNASQ